MEFSNYQEQLDALPSITHIEYQPVEKSYLKVMIIATLIMGVIFSIITGTLYFNIDEEDIIWLPYVLGAVFTLIFLISLVSSIQGFRRIGYALRQKDIVYKKGWIWQSKIIIPFNRIQHSEVNQNPIERIFGLAKLKVFTAGGSSSDLSIPGLTPERAEQLKFYITHKAAVDEEE